MIACFFTWSENIIITRAIKVVGRMGVLFSSYWVYKTLLNYGAVDSLNAKNIFSISFYLLYLALGFASLMWSTNVAYSGLQWFMTAQTLVFCYYFIKILYLLDEFFPDHKIRLYNLLGNSILVLIIVFIIGMWVAPDIFFRLTHGGEEARLGGYMMNPNELGMLAGVGIAGLIFDLYRKEKKFWTIVKLLILAYGLYVTGSRSSLIGVFLIIGFHVKQSSNVKLKSLMLLGMLLITPIAVYKVILKDGDQERLKEVIGDDAETTFKDRALSRTGTEQIKAVFEREMDILINTRVPTGKPPHKDIMYKGVVYELDLRLTSPTDRRMNDYFTILEISEECLTENKPMYLSID